MNHCPNYTDLMNANIIRGSEGPTSKSPELLHQIGSIRFAVFSANLAQLQTSVWYIIKAWAYFDNVDSIWFKKQFLEQALTIYLWEIQGYPMIYELFLLHDNTGQKKKHFFSNSLEFFIYSGAEWYPKHDITFRFSIN